MEKQNDSLKERFLANLPYKMIAFIIAFALWFFVLNTIEPMANRDVGALLQVRNAHSLLGLAEPIHLANYEELIHQNIYVTVRGTQRNIDALNIEAYIDLSQAYILYSAGGTTRLSVGVNVVGNFDDVHRMPDSVSPSTVVLHLDRIISRHVDVEFYWYGDVEYGFILIEEQATHYPPTLILTGPSEAINRIDRLVVEADMNGRYNHLLLENYRPRAVDADGNYVAVPAYVEFSSYVHIYVPVYQLGVVRFNDVSYTDPAPGFGVLRASLTQRYFNVFGSADAIYNLSPLYFETLQLHDRSTSFSQSFIVNNYLPSGIYLVDRMNYRTTVNIEIEPIQTRTFTINREDVTVTGLTAVSNILTEQVNVTIAALESVMAGIVSPAASIDLTWFGYGQHQINLNIDIPPRAQIVGVPPSLTVVIGDLPAYDDPYEYPPPYEPDDDEPYEDYEYEYEETDN
ncbi:MAG: hypothetical protein FWB74_09525 [Defluviitaleaceae bacterium]|nr:hypothetical protein [Defluviitaleaceae bacterium]